MEDDPLPPTMRHIRVSENKVRDEVYRALSNLVGAGLSESEAAKAVVIVSNRMFGRSFKEAQPLEENQTYDKNTLPDKRSLIDKLNKIEAQGLAAAATEITAAKKKDSALVHQSDSTTKKFVGKVPSVWGAAEWSSDTFSNNPSFR